MELEIITQTVSSDTTLDKRRKVIKHWIVLFAVVCHDPASV
jgi:hypothetical protein